MEAEAAGAEAAVVGFGGAPAMEVLGVAEIANPRLLKPLISWVVVARAPAARRNSAAESSLPFGVAQNLQVVTVVRMACAPNYIATGLASYGLYTGARVLSPSYRNFPQKSSYKFLKVRALQGNDGGRRLIDIIRIIPELSRNYFKSGSRRALFGGIALLGGFYVAQTISLSFGALAVNDVIAAVVCVLLTEYVTKFYYSRPKLIYVTSCWCFTCIFITYAYLLQHLKLLSWCALAQLNLSGVKKTSG
ncbi:hypothetical protein ZWY2020_055902 [Hordeum vulgare]|nr:hypothetical protein ZWY2020_055902 [Hordeum vulgare]